MTHNLNMYVDYGENIYISAISWRVVNLMSEKNNLRFNGSIWCNLDIALRNIDQYFRRQVRSLGLTVIEWYILRALFEQDGQHASELARAVGRAATSFTPNLDKLQDKGLIERKSDTDDRRAVKIFLTDKAEAIRDDVVNSVDQIDGKFDRYFNKKEIESFQAVLSTMQTLVPD